MKNIRLILSLPFLICGTAVFAQNNVGVGTTTPDPSAILDVTSANHDKGMLVPSMNTLQRLGITNPANGLLVYDTDLDQFWYYNEGLSTWLQASGAQQGEWAGLCIYNSVNHGNVGSPCSIEMIPPVLGIQQCAQGWSWVNISGSNQQSGSSSNTEWTGACVKN